MYVCLCLRDNTKWFHNGLNSVGMVNEDGNGGDVVFIINCGSFFFLSRY
jgi:hypothetical protein